MDERPLSARLHSKCADDGLTYEQASKLMGQSENAVSRWITLTVIPGPEKIPAIAEFLGISEFEAGGAISLDLIARSQAKLSR